MEDLTQKFSTDPTFAQIQEIMAEGVHLSAKCVEQIDKACGNIVEGFSSETNKLYSDVQELATELEARKRFRNLSMSEIVPNV